MPAAASACMAAHPGCLVISLVLSLFLTLVINF
jgi:hypothetical protein